MAVDFKSRVGRVTTASTSFLTATKQTIVVGATLANRGTTGTAAAAWVVKANGQIADIVRNGSLPSGSSLIVAGGDTPKIFLETGDKIFAALHSGAVTVDLILSYAEVD